MESLVDKTYGRAFFELSLETGKVDEYAEEIRMLRAVMKESPDFMRILNHPGISQERKIKLTADCFQGRFSEDVLRFLKVIIEARRQDRLVDILEAFSEEVRRYKHIGKVRVTSAAELDSAEKKAVEKRLLETTEYRAFEMTFDTDASLLGGMKIRIDDMVVDGSIKHYFRTMTKALESVG